MIRFRALIVALGAFAMAACGDGGAGGGAPPPPPPPVSPPAPPPSPPTPPPPPPDCCAPVQIASGLDNPWSIVFLPDGAALVTERDRLAFRRIAQPGGPSPQLGAAIPLPSALNAVAEGQGGLLDVALDPNFAASRLIFFAYVDREGAAGQPTRLAVARAELASDGQSIANAQRIFRIDTPSTDPRHYSGRLAFLADGTLLVTAGDRHEDQNTLEAGQGPSPVGAQVANSGLGKIHRINRDGTVPANAAITQPAGAPAGLASEYTRGHRNPQGLVVDAASGRVWSSEHGPNGGDELNLIVAGRNYGWPLIGRGGLAGGAPQPQPSSAAYTDPLVFWTPAIAPSGMTLYTGSLFPQFAGDLFIAALGGQRILRIDLDASGAVVGAPVDVLTGQGRLRDVEMGPDGKLYVLTDDNNGRVLRLDPT